MRPQPLLAAAGLVLASLVISPALLADATLTFSDSRSPEQTSFLVHDGRILMQGVSRDGGKFSSIYDSRKRHFLMIDHGRKQYYVMDEATLNQQMEMMDQAKKMMRQQMEARLKDLPAEQRKMMEQRMKAMFEPPKAPPAPKIEVQDSGKGKEVNGIPCRIYRILANGKPERETCVAQPDALGLARADYDALRSMFRYMSEMADRFSQHMGGARQQNTAELMTRIDGVPVAMHHLVRGYESRLEGLSTDALDPALFEVPDGFTRVDPVAEMRKHMPGAATRR